MGQAPSSGPGCNQHLGFQLLTYRFGFQFFTTWAVSKVIMITSAVTFRYHQEVLRNRFWQLILRCALQLQKKQGYIGTYATSQGRIDVTVFVFTQVDTAILTCHLHIDCCPPTYPVFFCLWKAGERRQRGSSHMRNTPYRLGYIPYIPITFSV